MSSYKGIVMAADLKGKKFPGRGLQTSYRESPDEDPSRCQEEFDKALFTSFLHRKGYITELSPEKEKELERYIQELKEKELKKASE